MATADQLRRDASIQPLIDGLREDKLHNGGTFYMIGSVGQAIESAIEDARRMPLMENEFMTPAGWVVFHLEGAAAVLKEFEQMQRRLEMSCVDKED